MSINLYPVTHPSNKRARNRWCGPGALSILTGVNTQQASRIIREHTGQARITGTSTAGLLRSLETMGVSSVRFVQMDGECTLNQLRDLMSSDLATDRTFLVIAGNHFQILQGNTFADNQVDGPIEWEDLKKGKRRRVEEVHELFLNGPITIPPYASKPKPSWRAVRAKAIRLAKKLDLDIEYDGWAEEEQTVWIFASREDQPEPEEWRDEHYVYGWEAALTRVEEYAKFIS